MNRGVGSPGLTGSGAGRGVFITRSTATGCAHALTVVVNAIAPTRHVSFAVAFTTPTPGCRPAVKFAGGLQAAHRSRHVAARLTPPNSGCSVPEASSLFELPSCFLPRVASLTHWVAALLPLVRALWTGLDG